jgi:ribokinase
MAGCVGADDFGVRLLEALDSESVDTSAVRQVPGTASGLALIPVDPFGENMVTVAAGANETVGDEEVRSAFEHPVDVLVISAEIPALAITAALSQAREAHHAHEAQRAGQDGAGALICLLNLAPVPPHVGDLLAAGVDWLVVNEIEAAAVLGHPVSGLADADAAAGELLSAGAARAVVTAGAAGAAYAGPDGTVTVSGFPVRAVDSVGAGDTFVGALATAIGAGATPESAVRAASAAAAVATTRRGTQAAMPHPAEITALTGVPWPPTS